MINLSSNLALFGSFDSFAAISKPCIGMVQLLLRVHKVDGISVPHGHIYEHYLTDFPKNMPAIFNTVFTNPDIYNIFRMKNAASPTKNVSC